MPHHDDRQKLLETARSISIENIHNMLFSSTSPENGWIHGTTRMNLLLKGGIILRCFENNRFFPIELTAPAIYYCSTSGYQQTTDDAVQPYREALSFCYYPNYIRMVLFQGDGRMPKAEAAVYYHSAQPLSAGGLALLNAFEQLQAQGRTTLARRLLNELYTLTIDELEAMTDMRMPRQAPRLWDQINTYLRNHREGNPTREHVARVFGISPGYVSRLARHYANTDFVTLVTNYRLEHAAKLLRDSTLTIAEIAEQTGFHYLSYFYRRFKLRYRASPKNWRDQAGRNPQIQNNHE